jgi:hypothetical protein
MFYEIEQTYAKIDQLIELHELCRISKELRESKSNKLSATRLMVQFMDSKKFPVSFKTASDTIWNIISTRKVKTKSGYFSVSILYHVNTFCIYQSHNFIL